ncbi:MAG: sodium/solute symporter [Rikenellaceae bacterium]|nr:sodium/solute symporter [Rikenellaceae bacterium]
MNFSTIDFVIFAVYCVFIVGLGLWVSRDKKGTTKGSKDYFLASKALPWWAVGASLIASNISAEQFIGMSGSGYAIGMGIASYEFMAALTLIIVAAFFLPIYLHRGIYTMPQFLEQRFNKSVKTVMAIFWLLVFVFVNLTSILYLGALAIQNIMGVDMFWGIVGLALFAAIYSIYGGLKAVAWTDVVQVVFLIGGGLVTTYVALDLLGGDGGVGAGVRTLVEKAPSRFDMILEKGQEGYMELPGLSVLIGGLWIANLYYWGCNQYIIQRALASKSLDEAQKGLAFAGFLKILLPLIIVIPGIICWTMIQEGQLNVLSKSDDAYPTLLNMIPSGIKGWAFAALVAAIVSSLASMMNSVSSIFTMDIYKSYINKGASDTHMVKVGRVTSVVALLIACFMAPLLGTLDQAFQFIQEFTGFVSPGALAIFLAGFFYKPANSAGAMAAAIGTFVFSAMFKLLLPGIPFIDRMMLVFLLCIALILLFSAFGKKNSEKQKELTYPKGLFKTSRAFKICSIVLVAILLFIYTIWW